MKKMFKVLFFNTMLKLFYFKLMFGDIKQKLINK